ncbi:MAG: glycosyltransferase [Hydrococcus sp. Prado102]|jgi:rhamnosyltransferase|nr:glycosyltransferase [Hydrococcus sp. Prado102]
METTISILIRTKNEAKDLPKALELIRQQSLKPTEIIVVDSGSTDGTVEIIRQQNDIKLIEMKPEEFTFGRSLNIGFQAAKADIIISLSAHAFPCDRDWLKHLVQHFDNPQIAGVYGKQAPQPDAWPPVQRDYLDYYGDRMRLQSNPEKFNDYSFSNANSAIRRQYWEKRLFDETLTGNEDQEWAQAMLKKGYKIVYEPKAAVYHSHNEPLFKVYQRTYREALATQQLYERKMTLRGALETYYRSILADRRFILDRDEQREWLLRSPVYRLFWTFGYLRPNLPNALWEPLINQWKRISSLAEQKE